MLRAGFVFMLSSVLLACAADEPAPPSVAGKPVEEQAEITTEVFCDYFSRCGVVSVTCDDCVGEECGGCTVDRDVPTYAECSEDVGDSFSAALMCQPIDDEHVALLDECLQALADAPCDDLAEVEAWANGEEQGELPTHYPDVCVAIEAVANNCDDSNDGGMMPEPG